MVLRVVQVDREVLDRFSAAVGGLGKVHGPYHYRSMGPNRRAAWHWHVGRFEQAQAVIAMLWKFLGTVKRKQAAAALRDYITDARKTVG